MEQNNQNTALLVIDMQVGILGNFPGTEAILATTKKAIAKARGQKIPVIYVVVGFRQGAPEVSMNNKTFSAGKERFAQADMATFMTVHPDIAPAENEIIVTKRRVSAFAGSDLEVVLRSMNITHMVLTGVATSGAILSTTREAADKDYLITVISDCCGEPDEEVQRVLMTKILNRQANVVTVEDWLK